MVIILISRYYVSKSKILIIGVKLLASYTYYGLECENIRLNDI